jgi:hypothetical protein
MKRVLLGLAVVLITLIAAGQSNKYDSVAIIIIDRMSDVIGDLESCNFKVKVANDVPSGPKSYVKYFTDYEIYMYGPDKLMVNARGYKGHRKILYNGDQLAYYSFDENNYGIIPSPRTVIKMFDSVHQKYDIDFPAADFFYPAFTDDLLQHSDSLRYLGMEKVGAHEYFHIVSYGKEMTMQFWINNDSYNLPARFAITYTQKQGFPQYMAIFSDWEINPVLPNAMFNFQPPPNARRLRIMSKSDR